MRPRDRECVRSIPVRPGGRWVLSGAFGSFPFALGVVGFVGVCSVHIHSPWGSSGSFMCVRSIAVRPCGLRVGSGAFVRFPRSLRVVGFPPGAFGSFPRALRIIGCVRSIPVRPGGSRFLRSYHSRAYWGLSGSFVYGTSISVLPWCRRVCFG